MALEQRAYWGLFINDIIIFGRYRRFSLQTIHVLRIYTFLSIQGWSEVKPAKYDEVIYEQPLMPIYIKVAILPHGLLSKMLDG